MAPWSWWGRSRPRGSKRGGVTTGRTSGERRGDPRAVPRCARDHPAPPATVADHDAGGAARLSGGHPAAHLAADSSRATFVTRPTNAPYEPQFYPTMPEPWRGYLARFLKFCEWVPIDPKEGGVMWHGIAWAILLSSQRYLIEEIFCGLSQGFHDFVIVKARQLGASTLLWLLDLW